MTETTHFSSSPAWNSFLEDGYCILPSLISKEECFRFDLQVVQPALETHAGITERNPSSWRNNRVLRDLATANADAPQIPGVMVRNPLTHSDPIQHEVEQRWPALLEHPRLLRILDELHSFSSARNDATGTDYFRNWEWLHPHNVGWIHVRFPVDKTSYTYEMTWHVDGGHFTPHLLHSPEQSVVVLPMLRNIQPGGGNTVILRRSHCYMAHLLRSVGMNGLDRCFTQDCGPLARVWPEKDVIEVAPCQVGDVLLLHPLTVHSSGLHIRPDEPLRVTFNLGTRWKIHPLSKQCDEMSSGIKTPHGNSLQEMILAALERPPPALTAGPAFPFALPRDYFQHQLCCDETIMGHWVQQDTKSNATWRSRSVGQTEGAKNPSVFLFALAGEIGRKVIQFGDIVTVWRRHNGERCNVVPKCLGQYRVQTFCNLDGVSVLTSDELTLVPVEEK